MGCRSCQVACKAWNDNPGESTQCVGSYQNPPALSSDTWSLIQFNEVNHVDKFHWVFNKLQCRHCEVPGCISVCQVDSLEKTLEGPVIYNSDTCIACHRCVAACPFDVPRYDDEGQGILRKCTFCADRLVEGLEPACVKSCSTDGLVFGERDILIAEGKRRIAARPAKYVDHIYGENEVGGTSWLYLSPVPFDLLGFPDVGDESVALVWEALRDLV